MSKLIRVGYYQNPNCTLDESEKKKIIVLHDKQAAVGALRTGKNFSCLLLTRCFYNVARKSNVDIRWVSAWAL